MLNKSTRKLTAIKSTAIIALVLAFALSAAWALEIYSNSRVYGVGEGGKIKLVKEPNKTFVRVPEGSLDGYLAEHNLNEVEITVEMIEELVEREDGSTYYQVMFIFGPSGCYFEEGKELKLTLNGKYAEDPNVWLYDENGEALEGKRKEEGKKMVFYIPHFSSYSYDEYDY